MVRHRLGPTHCPKVNGVKALQLLEPIRRHHLPMLGVVVAISPLELFETQFEIKFLGRRLHNTEPFGHYFFTDTITGYHCNLAHFHLLNRLLDLREDLTIPKMKYNSLFG